MITGANFVVVGIISSIIPANYPISPVKLKDAPVGSAIPTNPQKVENDDY